MSTSRKVQVFSTKGKRKATIETDATKWSQLRTLIEDEGYDVGKLHATENINRTDLAHDDAALPEGEFTLFLRPKKTKSGIDGLDGLSFKELRAIAKEYKKKDGDDFIDHLNDNKAGVNWTRLSAVDLKAMMETYGAEDVKEEAPKKAPKEEKVEEVTEAAPEMNNEARLYVAAQLIGEVGENTNDEFLEVRCDDVLEEIEELREAVILEDGPTNNVGDLVAAVEASKGGDPAEIEALQAKINDLDETIADLTERLDEKRKEKDELEEEASKLMAGF